jgi:hypothetical protein
MADEPLAVVGPRVSSMPLPHVPSVRGACGRCREPIWLSAASDGILRQRPGSRVLCLVCFLAERAVAGEDPLNIVTTPEQVAELRDYLAAHPDRRSDG